MRTRCITCCRKAFCRRISTRSKSISRTICERKRLAQVLTGVLEAPVGYVLPLHWSHKTGKWHSSPWQFRRGEMFLVPGDSPMGLRLPLGSLPWVPFEDARPRARAQPIRGSRAAGRHRFAGQPPLQQDRQRPSHDPTEMEAADDAATHDPEWTPHTALTVEAREGRLHIFMPPANALEHYLDIVASVEATAEALKMPVVIEGYQPPHDPRLTRLPVTPDPGVIEVNIHPAASWEELVHNTTTLYEQARLTRLGTEKFMLDGRHTGTGGGNHVTLGGATPADSPILRRPICCAA